MTSTEPATAPQRAGKQALAIRGVGRGRGDSRRATLGATMAVSIAGVSTACSKDALASSAEAVRKTLAPE